MLYAKTNQWPQKQQDGDATLCCAREKREPGVGGSLACGGAAYICLHFYDSAPSGSYGTMSYMIRAVTATLNCFPQDGELDCTVSWETQGNYLLAQLSSECPAEL